MRGVSPNGASIGAWRRDWAGHDRARNDSNSFADTLDDEKHLEACVRHTFIFEIVLFGRSLIFGQRVV